MIRFLVWLLNKVNMTSMGRMKASGARIITFIILEAVKAEVVV